MELQSFLKLVGKLAAIDQTASALSLENVRVHWKGKDYYAVSIKARSHEKVDSFGERRAVKANAACLLFRG
jgi:hypothetical protein